MTDHKRVQKSTVDELAQFIRKVDGNHKMGAGALAEKICERFRVDTPAVRGALMEGLRYTFDGALAECPYCGSLDVGGAHDTVHCQSCGLTVTKPGPLQNAVDAWNTNAIDAWNTRARRAHSAAPAAQGEQAEQYNHKRIGWELERTAMGDGYYGNSLRVAKDIPGLTDQDRAVLDRYATGSQHDTDHIALQDIAMRIYTAPQPVEQPTISAYACTVPDDCETLHWRGQVLSMNELMSVAQPVVDEEIHVHIEGRDVLTLPLAASGMSAPRFVVHVPAQQPAEQQPAHTVQGVPEDLRAAMLAVIDRNDWRTAANRAELRTLLAAAPAVHGEPLGYVVPRMAARLGKGELCGISVLDQPEDGHTLPVYLTPQPAEQQPTPDAVEIYPKDLLVQPWSSRARSQWDYSWDRGVKITHVPSGITVTCDTERSLHANKNKAWGELQLRLAANRAPDVAGLLDLLRDIGNVCRKPEMPSEQAIAEWADRIDAALQEGEGARGGGSNARA